METSRPTIYRRRPQMTPLEPTSNYSPIVSSLNSQASSYRAHQQKPDPRFTHRDYSSIKPEDTPIHLRILEKDWKSRRRRILEDVSNEIGIRPVGNAKHVCSETGQTQSSQHRLAAKNASKTLINSTGVKLEDPVRHDVGSNPTSIMGQGNTPPTPPDTPPALIRNPSRRPSSSPRASRAVLRTIQRSSVPAPICSPHDDTTKAASFPPITHPVLPILASPLPPTQRPVLLATNTGETIHVCPSPSLEVIIVLAPECRLVVQKGGLKMTLLRYKEKGGWTTEKKLDAGESGQWDASDRNEWELARKLVEEYKMRTAQAVLYHSLGNITITCSSPPDIVISFQIPLASDNKDSSVDIKIKVRLVYARLAQELRIDTSCVKLSAMSRGFKPQEKLRTKRRVSLLQHGEVSHEDDNQTQSWKLEEIEGLRRLWETKPLWDRWS